MVLKCIMTRSQTWCSRQWINPFFWPIEIENSASACIFMRWRNRNKMLTPVFWRRRFAAAASRLYQRHHPSSFQVVDSISPRPLENRDELAFTWKMREKVRNCVIWYQWVRQGEPGGGPHSSEDLKTYTYHSPDLNCSLLFFFSFLFLNFCQFILYIKNWSGLIRFHFHGWQRGTGERIQLQTPE